MLELMTGNVVISRVDYLNVCRTKRGRKTRVLGGISWYRKMYNVIDEVSHKPRSL